MNEMQFYDIQAIDTGNLSQGISKYRSTHIFSDMALIRGTKFY